MPFLSVFTSCDLAFCSSSDTIREYLGISSILLMISLWSLGGGGVRPSLWASMFLSVLTVSSRSGCCSLLSLPVLLARWLLCRSDLLSLMC